MFFSFVRLSRPVFSVGLVWPHFRGNTLVSTFLDALFLIRVFSTLLRMWTILNPVCTMELVLHTPFQKIFSKPHIHALIGIQTNLKTGVGSSLQTMITLSLGSSLLSGTSPYKLQDVLALFTELEIMTTSSIQIMSPYTITHWEKPSFHRKRSYSKFGTEIQKINSYTLL